MSPAVIYRCHLDTQKHLNFNIFKIGLFSPRNLLSSQHSPPQERTIIQPVAQGQTMKATENPHVPHPNHRQALSALQTQPWISSSVTTRVQAAITSRLQQSLLTGPLVPASISPSPSQCLHKHQINPFKIPLGHITPCSKSTSGLPSH